MISPELLRRYKFFSGFSHEQLGELAMAADIVPMNRGQSIFHEGDVLTSFSLILSGSVALTQNIPDRNERQTSASHITGNFITKAVNIGTLGEQEIFGWSALIPPFESTAGAQAKRASTVINFDMMQLRPIMEKYCSFGQLLTLKAAQVVRDRLRMRRMELLSDYTQDI